MIRATVSKVVCCSKLARSCHKAIHDKSDATILLVTHTTQLVSYGTRALQMANGVLRE